MICPPSSLPEVPLPLLITGVAGVPGYNAFRYFYNKYPGQVVGTRRTDNWPLKRPGVVPCDVDDRDAMKRLFDKHQFASVLNSEGSCKLKSCELDPSKAWRINVDGVDNLLSAIGPSNVRLVHLSIDLVFSGHGEGNHVETDPTDPVTVYGKSMAIAEQMLLSRRPEAAILRISLPMGVSFNGHAGAIDWIQSRFKKAKPATLYYDEWRTPTYTDCLNRVCEAVLANDLAGLYHAGGPQVWSLFQIAQIVNRVGGYDPQHLMRASRLHAGPIPPRAGNVTLNSSRLKAALGYAPFDPWPLHEEHWPTHDDWHRERDTFQGSPELLSETLYNNPAFTTAPSS